MLDEELSRRAVACKAWRWMEGMVTTSGKRVIGFSVIGTPLVTSGDCSAEPIDSGAVPDFDDPATEGCLFSLVRVALGDPLLYAFPRSRTLGGWVVREYSPGRIRCEDTCVHALVRLLEEASR